MKFLDFYTHVYHNRIGDFRFELDDICFDTYQNSALDPLLDGCVPRAGSPVIETFALYYGDRLVGNCLTRITANGVVIKFPKLSL
jgi:hypothetical protein